MICTKCNEDKDADEFSNRGTKKQGYCKQCHSTYRRQHYLNNKVKYINKAKAFKINVVPNLRQKVLEYLKEHPCVDCGETDTVVLEFDHREQSDKKFTISRAISCGYGWETLINEIDKCDVRCANCHRRRTSIQLGWWNAI